MRVLFDTSVWISALVYGGTPRQAIDYCLAFDVDIVISEEIITELRRIVYAKFPAFSEELELLEVLLQRDAILVRLGAIEVRACRDSRDNHVLEAAILGGVSIIVTGDKDLLSLKNYTGVAIRTPTEFLESL